MAPNINEMKSSKFLKKEDCGPGILVTIRSVELHNVSQEGAPEDQKWCITFEEVDKPMVTNQTNNAIIAAITKSQDTENWTGKKIVLFNDPTVMFKGEIKGGIRARAPKGTTVSDDLPF